MIWMRDKDDQIHPKLDSLGPSCSQHRSRVNLQVELELHKTNWKFMGSIVSSMAFVFLFFTAVIAIPIILTKLKQPSCSTTSNENADDQWLFTPPDFSLSIPRLCAANASWDPQGVTVAGFANGFPSTSLAGLQLPNDVYVYANGTILVVDSNNNRIIKWKPNATVGELIAGTGAFGSWNNLLARPASLAVRNKKVYVSDLENYRIQMFPVYSNQNFPDGMTIIGKYGQGSDVNQINEVTSIIAPVLSPSSLYLVDSKNHRILLWNSNTRVTQVVAGRSNVSGSDSVLLYNPTGIALDERTASLYIADKSNNRVQKYNMRMPNSSVTVAGWGQLNNPYGIQLEPFGNNLFIADTLNHRILLWLNGAREGRIIAGTGILGNTAYQLNNPVQVRFDAKYNLYVVDMNNNRIQRFNLIFNGC